MATNAEPHADDRKSLAARVRVARAWANISQPELAERLNVSHATVKRIELGQRPIATAELIAVAQACGVPTRFMLRGFTEPARRLRDDADLIEGVEILNARLAEIERVVGDNGDQIGELLRRLYADPPPSRARAATR